MNLYVWCWYLRNILMFWIHKYVTCPASLTVERPLLTIRDDVHMDDTYFRHVFLRTIVILSYLVISRLWLTYRDNDKFINVNKLPICVQTIIVHVHQVALWKINLHGATSIPSYGFLQGDVRTSEWSNWYRGWKPTSVALEFKFQLGYVWRVFQPSLRLVTVARGCAHFEKKCPQDREI